MTDLLDQTTEGLISLVFSGLWVTPLLAVSKLVLPIPWIAVFIPWIVGFHLILCWCAARFIAKVFWDLARLLEQGGSW